MILDRWVEQGMPTGMRKPWWRRYWPFWRDIVKAVIILLIFLMGFGAFRVMDSYLGTYNVFLGLLENELIKLQEEDNEGH